MNLPQRYRRVIIFLFFLIVFGLGVKFIFSLLTPFLLGLFLTYLIEPPVDFLERRLNLPRWLSVSIVLFITLFLLCFLLTLVLSRVYLEIREVLTDLPERIVALHNEIERIQARIKTRFDLPEELWKTVFINTDHILHSIRGILQQVLNALRLFPSFIFNLFLSGLAAYFFSRDKEKIILYVFSFFPKEWRQPGMRLHQEIIESTFRFIKVQLILVVMTSILTAFFLGLLGFSRAGLIGLVVGLLDFLPMIGPAAFFLPWVGWLFFTGKFAPAILLTTVLLLILGVRQVAEVRLVKESLDIHPLAALLAVYLGLQFFGIYGFFIGPLFFVLLRSFYQGILPLLNEDLSA